MIALYQELLRPQFHFTARRNWLNDPNGLIYFQGEYHLFFQHNPLAMSGAGINMHWGHAVSPDLVHWTELPIALHADAKTQAWSGSAVIDWRNTTGLGRGAESPMIAVYTRLGLGQCLAISHDRGRTFAEFIGNPVLPAPGSNPDRDPKVFWHAASAAWVIVLWEGKGYSFYRSLDLQQWSRTDHLDGYYECPDLFQLAVDENPDRTKWVLVDGTGAYTLGDFDGYRFAPTTDKLPSDIGPHYYATQSWNELPPEQHRRVQIAWMRGGQYPDMPFSQQMTFPVELSLKTFPDGVQMCRKPVREIVSLYQRTTRITDRKLPPGENALADWKGELLHLEFQIYFGSAESIELNLRGQRVTCRVVEGTLCAFGRSAPLGPHNGRISMECLLDRTSLEVFAQNGRVAISGCFVPDSKHDGHGLTVQTGQATIMEMKVHELKSIWDEEKVS